jgi:uncharacterized protein YheU (UPF0270 family)
MHIPYEHLSPVALRAVVSEFVTRDGTDHTNVEERIAAVMEQLDQGTAVIFFDPDNKSCDISLVGKTAPRESQDKL